MKGIFAACAIALTGAVAWGLAGAEEAEAYCPIDQSCPDKGVAEASMVRGWELSAQRFAYQMEQGVLEMAGTPRFR